MNRKYTADEFIKVVKRLRNNFPEVMLTTDIIVGFPGETEKEFETTYNYLKEIKFYKMHVFKFSPRKGTVAEKMTNQIDGNIKEERSSRLIELSNKNEEEYLKKYIGKEVEIRNGAVPARGTVQTISPDGKLVLNTPAGQTIISIGDMCI